MAAAAERTDELVREYLLFRGFTAALKQLDAEIKADREKGFRVDKIVDQLQQFVQSYDLAALRDYWSYLDRRLFSRLEDVYRPTVNKLKTSLLRYYLVHTVQTGRNDKAQEFFLKQASELQNQAEWKDWFVLPFLPAPDSNPTFATYFSRQWADTFIVSLHNFLSVLFQCMHILFCNPVILNFEAECLRSSLIQEENESLRHKLFALQVESSRMKKEELEVEQAVVHHKLPAYVANMDRLGDSELDMTCNQRSTAHSLQSRGGFLSSFLSQSKKGPSRPAHPIGASPVQTGSMLVGKKEPTNHQSAKGKEGTVSCKDGKSHFSGLVAGESSSLQQRQKRLQEHGKERKELLLKGTFQGQSAKKKTDISTAETKKCSELHEKKKETSTKLPKKNAEAVGKKKKQPFIVLSKKKYGEHQKKKMYCRVASKKKNGVIKVWSKKTIMQTKKKKISKSPLLSKKWATKREKKKSSMRLLLGKKKKTVRLYDTKKKKNLCEKKKNEDMPRQLLEKNNFDSLKKKNLSLACSPSGASFVCSAAAQSLISHMEKKAVSSGEKKKNQVPGKLQKKDTKTMKKKKLAGIDEKNPFQLQKKKKPEPVAINKKTFNHNGKKKITGAADGIKKLFDMQQKKCAMSWKKKNGEVYSVEKKNDENTVKKKSEDGKSEYNLKKKNTGPFVLSKKSGYKQVKKKRGRLFAFDSEGNYMLTCSSTGGLKKKKKVLESCLKKRGHRAPKKKMDWSTAMEKKTCLTA
ncbi:WDR91 protein, partial [Lophotis ruficrista]|nr:WDR91 protein [Lophotis ruficrista]